MLLATLLTCSTGIMAQPVVGAFAGVNSSSLAGDMPDKADYKGLIGLNAGVHVDLKLAGGIYLSLQPSYSQEGTRVFYNLARNEEPVDSLKIRLNYFSLPLVLKVTSSRERFYALGGIETGFMSGHQVSSHGRELETEIDIEKINIAMHFGVGLKIPLGMPRLFIELRYAQGLFNLTDEPVLQSYVPRVKTSGFKVLAGIEFPLKKSTE